MTAHQPPQPVTARNAYVQPREITELDEFFSRPIDRAHVRTLAQTIERKETLDRIVLWHDDRDPERPRLVLLDGRHRLAAYRAARGTRKGHNRGIPARILTCDRATAHLRAVEDNAKNRLALTTWQRMDAAWHLVRLFDDNGLSKRQIRDATGASERTVANMRVRWREMIAADKEPTGEWRRDRSDEAWQPAEPEEYEQLIETRLAAFKPAAGAMTRDPDAVVWEVLARSFGEHRLRQLFEYGLGGEEPDEFFDHHVTAETGTAKDPSADF